MIINRSQPTSAFNQQKTSPSFYIDNPPNYGTDGIRTQGTSNKSDAEIRATVEEMAKKHFSTGKNISQGVHSSEYQNLMNTYTSVASPNRRGAINNTLSSLTAKLSTMMPTFNMNRTGVLQALMQRSNLFPNNRDIGNNFINFRGSNGQLVAMYSELPTGGMGWLNVPTDAENSRASEFAGLYNEAWYDAQRELSTNIYNENVKLQTEALNEYSRLSAEVKESATPENIFAKNAARAAFEEASHRLVNIDVIGNKTKTTSRKVDTDSINNALERVAPGSTQQGRNSFNIQV